MQVNSLCLEKQMKGYYQHRTCDESTVGYILLHHKKKEDISAELQIDFSPAMHKIITLIRNTTQVCKNNNIQEQRITH